MKITSRIAYGMAITIDLTLFIGGLILNISYPGTSIGIVGGLAAFTTTITIGLIPVVIVEGLIKEGKI